MNKKIVLPVVIITVFILVMVMVLFGTMYGLLADECHQAVSEVQLSQCTNSAVGYSVLCTIGVFVTFGLVIFGFSKLSRRLASQEWEE